MTNRPDHASEMRRLAAEVELLAAHVANLRTVANDCLTATNQLIEVVDRIDQRASQLAARLKEGT